jgi:hypothetical protein
MDDVFRFQFRAWPRRHREDAVADARSFTWAAWRGLIGRGQDPVQVGVSGIAARCCRRARAGRKFGNRHSGRACLDILDPRARRRLGLTILRLDRHDGVRTGQDPGGWRESLCEDHRCTPADQATFRIDFETWLGSLPPRKRQMVGLLAEGHGTCEAARILNVTPAALSIARTWLQGNWLAFQGEETPTAGSTRAVTGRGSIRPDRRAKLTRRYARPGRPRLKPVRAGARAHSSSLPPA